MIKSTVFLSAITLFAGAALAADSPATVELTKAAKALGEKANYSWKSTVEVPADAQFKPGPTEGKIEKDGAMVVSSSFGQGTTQTVVKGDKIALTNRDGGWDSIAEVEANTEGFGRFRAGAARGLKAPADDVAEILKVIKELKKVDGVYAGELTEEAAKGMMSFGGRRRGGANAEGPNIPFAKASARFWVKDGLLSKMEIKVDGSMEFNGSEMQIVRTTTTEISEVGTTKVVIPDGAKAKLE